VFADESPDQNLDIDGSEICQECGEAPAVVVLLRIDDGEVVHARLCQQCAEDMAAHGDGGSWVLAMPSSAEGLGVREVREESEQASVQQSEPQVCGVCGTTLSDIKETGMVGCSICYEVFSDYLRAQLSEDGHELTAHLGKTPAQGSEADKVQREVLRLQHMLRELVEFERYEEAASVRDRLAELTAVVAQGSRRD
jgi:protein arginine kinase activator